MKDLIGKVAFITGGASGIGFGMARAMLGAGMKVIMADASQSNIDDAAAQMKGSSQPFKFMNLDVTDRAAMARAADEAERMFGAVHVLCNNAGIGSGAPVVKATYADWDRMIDINLNGVINGVVTFMPRLLAHGEGGHIVNTSSMAGIIPLPDPGCLYSTSKFAVRGMSESLRLSLAPLGVGVSVLCPGLTKTRILDQARRATTQKPPDPNDLSAGFVNAQKYAMDPLVLGEAVVLGIRRNDPFILPHGEFVDEVREMHDEIESLFRSDIPVDPDRAAFENGRRQMIRDIKAKARAR